MQRADLMAGADRLVRRLGRQARAGMVHRDKRLQPGLQAADAGQAVLHQIHRRQAAGGDFGRQDMHRQVGG
jgi:hypothetical protein